VDLFFLSTEEERRKLYQRLNYIDNLPPAFKNSPPARLGEIFKNEPQKIKLAYQLLLAQPIVPVIYYGNDLGQPNQLYHSPPADPRAYVRGPFDWDLAQAQIQDPNSILNSLRASISSRPIC
jgi:glycosidase